MRAVTKLAVIAKANPARESVIGSIMACSFLPFFSWRSSLVQFGSTRGCGESGEGG